jgi:hypothetical protein
VERERKEGGKLGRWLVFRGPDAMGRQTEKRSLEGVTDVVETVDVRALHELIL